MTQIVLVGLHGYFAFYLISFFILTITEFYRASRTVHSADFFSQKCKQALSRDFSIIVFIQKRLILVGFADSSLQDCMNDKKHRNDDDKKLP